MKNKNAGISLVELVVVIAIMAIILGMGFLGIGQLTGYRARECAKKIGASITENKITTLGKAKATGDICFELYKDASNSCYYVKTVYGAASGSPYDDGPKKVSKGRVSIAYLDSAGSSYTVDEANPLRFCFNRATGAICSAASPYAVFDITEIAVKSGTRTYRIKLVPATGKVISK